MDILSITPNSRKIITGRLSDGLDRQEKFITTYDVIVQEGYKKYQYTFEKEPTELEIEQAYNEGLFDDITTESEELLARLAKLEEKTAYVYLKQKGLIE